MKRPIPLVDGLHWICEVDWPVSPAAYQRNNKNDKITLKTQTTMLGLILAAEALLGLGASIGAAIAAIAAGIGIGKIGSSAMEAIARQPEAAGDIRSNMIVIAALVEGVALFAVIVCVLALFV